MEMFNPFTPFSEVNWRPNRAETRAFGWSLVIGFPSLAIALLLSTRLWSGAWRVTPFLRLGGYGLAAGILFVAIPQLARPFYLLWHFLACCIGTVVRNTLLTAFYLLVMTPLGAAMRVFGRQVISRTFDRKLRTYWVDVDNNEDTNTYYRQF